MEWHDGWPSGVESGFNTGNPHTGRKSSHGHALHSVLGARRLVVGYNKGLRWSRCSERVGTRRRV